MSPGTGLGQDAGAVPAASGSVTHSPWAERSRGRGPRGSDALPCCHPGWEPTSGDGRAPAASQQGRGIPPRPGRACSRGPVLPRPASGGQVPHGPTPRGSGPIWTRVQGLAGRSLCLRPPASPASRRAPAPPPAAAPRPCGGTTVRGRLSPHSVPDTPSPGAAPEGPRRSGSPSPVIPTPMNPHLPLIRASGGSPAPGSPGPPAPFPRRGDSHVGRLGTRLPPTTPAQDPTRRMHGGCCKVRGGFSGDQPLQISPG